jgi:hypothetical protein
MRMTKAVLACALLLSTVACNDNARGTNDSVRPPSPATSSASPTKHAANVVHLQGIGEVRFGDSREQLVSRKLIKVGEPGCDGSPVYDVPGYVDAADLVFNAQDQLAFVWVLSPGVHTPEKLSVDSQIAAVRKAYPQGEELKANDRSYPGLLVKDEKTALLFLYEPTTGQVIKLLAGYTDMLREGQRAGITC